MAPGKDKTQPSPLRRFFSSVWLKMIIFVVLFVLVTTLVANGTSTKVEEKQTEFLADAVRRSAVQCYALEGRFPDNLSYLEDHYGLIIDHDNFAVYYEPMGGNLLPQIRVIPLSY